MIAAFFQVGFAMVLSGLLAMLVEHPIGRVRPVPEAVLAVIWLGVLGSGLAYLAYFRILREWTAMRTTAVAYVLPVVGIAMGTLRGEAITLERVAGVMLIAAGVGVVNSKLGSTIRIAHWLRSMPW